ncbi:hypothetical protein SELR_pSRC400350 (plasmid) [Selenomonas ruminantium subsp. lactilytica TAM6421]|uniref:Uncharacterized protein n=1 Tax=Selenomonas ruminantium subsp. lactilytica (strain NBRC 103574 / TAM6421) TaxID=927704 RepID=I0GV99_SELRL|nr:hypothetical protein [Selenomonas ruminantium]BAL84686.1 hypothetical protein SELR_pSRC400350 [Selenomonas ruminantium subsp. lactilytica TAM6421]
MTDNFIKCRDGKDREIFPALIKDRKRIQHFIVKFRTDMAILNLLSPDLAKVAEIGDFEAASAFSDEPYDAMMEMLVMAFGNKYTAEQLEEFVDVAMVPKIFDVFFAISGYKDTKKKTSKSK